MAQNSTTTIGHSAGDHGAPGSMHHVIPLSTYIKTMIALLFLTALTTLVARPVTGFDIGPFNTLLNFLIAAVKGCLVLTFFMGLKYDKKMHLGIFAIGIFFLLIMLLFCILDIYTRVHVVSPLA